MSSAQPRTEGFTKPITPAQLAEFSTFMEQLVKISGAIISRHYLSGVAVDTKSDQSPVTAANRDTKH